jgi:hypothetical protein
MSGPYSSQKIYLAGSPQSLFDISDIIVLLHNSDRLDGISPWIHTTSPFCFSRWIQTKNDVYCAFLSLVA